MDEFETLNLLKLDYSFLSMVSMQIPLPLSRCIKLITLSITIGVIDFGDKPSNSLPESKSNNGVLYL